MSFVGTLREQLYDLVDRWLQALGENRLAATTIVMIGSAGLLAGIYGIVWTTGGTQGPYVHAAYVPIVLTAAVGGIRASLVASVLATVLLGPLMPLDVEQGIAQATSSWIFRGAFYVGVGVFSAAATGVLRSYTRQRSELQRQLASTYSRNLRMFAQLVESRDEPTHGHCERVASNAVAIGRRLNLDQNTLGQLYWSGHLHDLGKIGVPEEILRKPGSLTAAEFDEVKKHASLGHTILMNVSQDFALIATGVVAHHERWDGGGYPAGLAGSAIPLFGRIVAVADVFEALTSFRPYRDPMSNEEAIAIIRDGDGSHFDPKIVAAFLAAYEEGDVSLEAVASNASEAFLDSVLHPDAVGVELIDTSVPWRNDKGGSQESTGTSAR